MNQDLILRRMKDSTEQLRKMENDEIRRLQYELNQVMVDKEDLEQRHSKLEGDYEELKRLVSSCRCNNGQRQDSFQHGSQKEIIQYEKTIEMYRLVICTCHL